jgi:hypothetical protein
MSKNLSGVPLSISLMSERAEAEFYHTEKKRKPMLADFCHFVSSYLRPSKAEDEEIISEHIIVSSCFEEQT